MEYRRLGASGLMVPALSLGAGTFGGEGPLFGAWGRTDAAEARRLEAHFVTESRVCHQRFLAEDPAGAVVFARARIGGRPRTPLASRPPNASEELAVTHGAIEGSASPADPKAPPRWGVVEGRGGAPAKVQLRLAR